MLFYHVFTLFFLTFLGLKSVKLMLNYVKWSNLCFYTDNKIYLTFYQNQSYFDYVRRLHHRPPGPQKT